MELRNLTDFPTDYLDAYCDAEFGHTNWEFVEPDEPRDDINTVVVFWKKSNKEEDGNISMYTCDWCCCFSCKRL